MVDNWTLIVGIIGEFLNTLDNWTLIVGIIGNLTTMALFLSPIPTFITISKKKKVAGFKPDPYLATVLNCAMWVYYGMSPVRPGSALVIIINAFGLGIELIYIGIIFMYSPWNRRRNILLVLLVELIFMAAIVALCRSSALLQMLCIIFNIAMYTSPLTIMRRVIQTKSVKYMPLYLSLAMFLNGITWAVYALLKFKPFVLVPNGLGALLGLVQLILYATYYRTTKLDKPKKLMSDVELSRAYGRDT